MKLVYAVVAAATFTSLISTSPASAAPPTVIPSPGYDARLQEERAAQSAAQVPNTPTSKSRRDLKRRRHHAH
jgi:hypothetical protein